MGKSSSDFDHDPNDKYPHEGKATVSPADGRHGQETIHDAVFGEITESGPNFRGVSFAPSHSHPTHPGLCQPLP
jgi:hypothetical protein